MYRDVVAEILADLPWQLERDLAAMRERLSGGAERLSPGYVRAAAVPVRRAVEWEILAILGEAVALGEEVGLERQAIDARSPLALEHAVYGRVADPGRQLVASAAVGLPGLRAQIARVAAAVDPDVEELVGSVLEAAPAPPAGMKGAEVVEAAHRALDAQDEALLALAEAIEQQRASS